MGGGMEGPPVRGPAGPRFPLLPAAAPPRQGRGLHPVRRWSKGVEGAGIMYGLFLCWGAAAAEGPQRGAVLARSTWLRRGAVWDRARAQYGAAEARTLLRWGAAWVRNAAQHAAAQGAQRGVAQGKACCCAGEPRRAGVEGGSLAHHRSSSRRDRSGCNGCVKPRAHGGELLACLRTAQERARRGAARFLWGLHSTAGAALACGAGEGAAGGGQGPGLRGRLTQSACSMGMEGEMAAEGALCGRPQRALRAWGASAR